MTGPANAGSLDRIYLVSKSLLPFNVEVALTEGDFRVIILLKAVELECRVYPIITAFVLLRSLRQNSSHVPLMCVVCLSLNRMDVPLQQPTYCL